MFLLVEKSIPKKIVCFSVFFGCCSCMLFLWSYSRTVSSTFKWYKSCINLVNASSIRWGQSVWYYLANSDLCITHTDTCIYIYIMHNIPCIHICIHMYIYIHIYIRVPSVGNLNFADQSYLWPKPRLESCNLVNKEEAEHQLWTW